MTSASVRVSHRRLRIAPDAPPAYGAVIARAQGAKGARIIDQGGVSLLDLRGGDGAVVLGWRDARVEAAVAATPQSCSTRLEAEAAERIGALLPSAEAVGFRTNLEAALIDALLAARALTGRDGAFFCDDETSALGDLESLRAALDRHLGEIAALIIRPMDAPRPFLMGARRLADAAGLMLVFDESRTAFRVDVGGAQTLAGVLPDLTLLGSSLANGRPIAAVVGRMEPMRKLAATGGRVSAAALAAACATLDRIAAEDAPALLKVRGAEIAAEAQARLVATGADRWLTLYGDPTWSLIAARPRAGLDGPALESALAAALLEQGVLSYGAHVPSLALNGADIDRLIKAYEVVLPILIEKAEAGAFASRARRAAA